MKKLLFVTASLSRGGAERVISILSDFYCKQGWTVGILVLFHGIEGYELNPNVRIIDRTSDKPSRKRFLECIRQARRVVKEERPDVILSFLDSICLIMGFACLGLKSKLICCERIDPSQTKRSLIFRKLINIIYSRSAKTVVQTQRAYDYFPAKVKNNSIIIPNPVRALCKAEKRVNRFVTAGRLTKQKNQKMLIDAFSEVNKKHSDWTLDIYGDGELKEELQRQIQSLNLDNCVHLKGNSPDLHREIANAGCFVLSSDYEGLSNALLEAMRIGLCCISTNCAGSDEAIQNYSNGIIVPIKDKQALIEAMLYVAENPDKAEAMAVNAEKTSACYAVENVTDRWKTVVESV